MRQQQSSWVSRRHVPWFVGFLVVLISLSIEELSAMDSYGFTGARSESGDSLIFLRARYYDSETGLFINRDPLGLKAGLNVYAYVGNNPVNRTDPEGLLWPLLAAPLFAGSGVTIGQ